MKTDWLDQNDDKISKKFILTQKYTRDVQLSISSTFYARVFRTKVFSAAFFLVTFWQKKALSYKKLMCKMLMKLTPGGSKRIEELSWIWGLILGSSQVTKSIVANLESNLKILLLSA